MIKTDRSANLYRYTGAGQPRIPSVNGSLLSQSVSLAFDRHISTPIEDLIADRVGYSPSQVRRLFWILAGEPLVSFVRRLRLERAAGVLTLSNASVSHIAEEAGYESPESFSKAFHARFACSPTTFRELNSTPDRLLPGYILWRSSSDPLPRRVRLRITPNECVTNLYDGPIMIARMLPDGRIDWHP